MRSRPSVDPAHSTAASPGRARSITRRLALSWWDGAALLSVVLWGLNFPITKLLMTAAPPLTVTFLRMALSSAVYAAILAASGRPWLPRGRDLRGFATAGLAGMALTSALYAQGLHLTTASHSGT